MFHIFSHLVVSTQRFILVIDDNGEEKLASHFFSTQLRSQNEDELTIKKLPLSDALKQEMTFDAFYSECVRSGDTNKWNVILPPLSDLLCFQRPAIIFQFLHKLVKCEQVKRVFLWASTPLLMHPHSDYIVAACQYMADVVIHLPTFTKINIIVRKPGGGVIAYEYGREKRKLINPTRSPKKITPEKTTAPKSNEQSSDTFKIELSEEELVARNAIKLPYERASVEPQAIIIYTPDDDDDFDDEDPDEDLCI